MSLSDCCTLFATGRQICFILWFTVRTPPAPAGLQDLQRGPRRVVHLHLPQVRQGDAAGTLAAPKRQPQDRSRLSPLPR